MKKMKNVNIVNIIDDIDDEYMIESNKMLNEDGPGG